MTIIIMLTTFFSSLLFLKTLRPLAFKFNLIDIPTKRKNHVGNVPLIGGICIFLSVLISYIVFIEFDEFINVLLITSSLILIQGIWDDSRNLQASTKMAFQTLLIIIVIYTTGLKLNSFGDLFGISHTIELGIFSAPITIIAVIGLTNAINMIDGHDGFAINFIWIAMFGLFCINLNSEMSSFKQLLLLIFYASLPFMIFNISPNLRIKVFLGDGGSLFLGFLISWALIFSAENENTFNPSFALWCVAIPLFDFFATVIMRAIKKRSLIKAGKDHLHHALQNAGFSKLQILVLTAFIGLFLLIVGKIIEDNLPHLSFSIFVILFLFYLYLRIHILPKKKI